MSTPEVKPRKPKANKSSDNFNPAVSKTTNTIPTDLPYDIVGSLRLKRSKSQPTDVRAGFNIDPERFRLLNMEGIKHGVSYEELVFALVDRELHAIENGTSNLTNYIPVLNIA